jgi:hypothetical protein
MEENASRAADLVGNLIVDPRAVAGPELHDLCDQARLPAWPDPVCSQPLQDGFGDLCPAAVDGQGVAAVLELLQLGHGS